MSVAGVDCVSRSANGEQCRVIIHAVNLSDSFPVFDEADQLAYDPAGRAFGVDANATANANGGHPVRERMHPEAVISVVLVYNLPARDRIDHFVLHGKAGTPGEIFSAP